jgi:hypothetical protein
MHEVRKLAGHTGIRTTTLYFARKDQHPTVDPDPPDGAKGQMSPSPAVSTVLATERPGGEWNGWIRWIGTYATPKTGLRPVSKGSAHDPG